MKRYLIFSFAVLSGILLFSSCSKSGPQPKLIQTSYQLYTDYSKRLQGENIEGLLWTSDYNFVASITGDTIKANHVGEATIFNEEASLYAKVIVKGKHNMYEEPYMQWGSSKSTIIGKFGTPDATYGSMIAYKNSNTKAPVTIYSFANDKLEYAAMMINTQYGTELVDFLAERYIAVAQVGTYDFAFVHRDNKDNMDLLVYVSLDTDYITVIYMPNTTKSSTPHIDFSDIKSML